MNRNLQKIRNQHKKEHEEYLRIKQGLDPDDLIDESDNPSNGWRSPNDIELEEMVIIPLIRIQDAEKATPLAELFDGNRTYMKLDLLVCPDGGELQVSVYPKNPDYQDISNIEEVKGMVMSVMADYIMVLEN